MIDPERDDRRRERGLDREDRAAHLHRFLSVTDDHARGAWIRGRCAAEDAALLKTTLQSQAAPVPSAACDARELPGARLATTAAIPATWAAACSTP